MTKKELIDAVIDAVSRNTSGKAPTQETMKATRLHTEAVIEAFSNVTAAELLGGGEITLPGLGKLKAKIQASRKGHNPKTGEVIEIPEQTRVVFVPFKEFRDACKL